MREGAKVTAASKTVSPVLEIQRCLMEYLLQLQHPRCETLFERKLRDRFEYLPVCINAVSIRVGIEVVSHSLRFKCSELFIVLCLPSKSTRCILPSISNEQILQDHTRHCGFGQPDVCA